MTMKKISNSAEVLEAIEEYLKRYNQTASTFGIRFARDPNLVLDMRQGRMLRMSTVDRLIPFLNQPPTFPGAVSERKLKALLERSERLLDTQEKATKKRARP